MQRAVLRVDGDDLGTGRAAGLLHDGRAGDERFLVGQRQALARLERRHRDREPGEADHGVEHHVRAAAASTIPSTPTRTSVPAGTLSRTSEYRSGSPMTTRVGRNSSAWATSSPAERCAARACTWKRSGSPRMTSSAWVPIEPVEPSRLTVRIKFSRGGAP